MVTIYNALLDYEKRGVKYGLRGCVEGSGRNCN